MAVDRYREAANILGTAREEHAEDFLRLRFADPKATDNQAKAKADARSIKRITNLEAELEIARAEMLGTVVGAFIEVSHAR